MKFITVTSMIGSNTVILPIEYESKNKFLADFYILMENTIGWNFYLGGQTWDKSYFKDNSGNYVLPEVMTFDEWFIDNIEKCDAPQDGWHCSRIAGHDGPCAAYPDETVH